jgi:hypothetical protein
MRAWPSSLVVVLALQAISVSQAGVLRGRIVDSNGHPVEGVVVATCWLFPDPDGEEQDEPPRPDDGARVAHTDAQGEFSLDVGNWSTVLALDVEGNRGALVSADANLAGPVTTRLETLVPVKGSFEVKAAGEPPGVIGAWLAPRSTPYSIARCLTASRSFAVLLPRGDYQLMYSTDLLGHHRMTSAEESIAATGDATDLGSIAIEVPRVVAIKGQVLDEGKAVAKAAVGVFWEAGDGNMHPFDGTETDASGTFVLKLEVYDPTRVSPLMALDASRTRVGLITIRPTATDQPVTITLAPAVRLHGKLIGEGSPVPLPWTNTYVEVLPQKLRLAQCSSTRAAFDFRLPAGKYGLQAYGNDTETWRSEATLSLDHPDLDLHDVTLKPTGIARNMNRPAPPLSVTAARGVDPSVTLAGYKGKWVLLEFWGFW